jgi:hypothetical protein
MISLRVCVSQMAIKANKSDTFLEIYASKTALFQTIMWLIKQSEL